MSQRRPVEFVPKHAPARHVPVHQLPKAVVVAALDQVDKLMRRDVFQAGRRLLGQFEIQPDAPRLGVARSPAGLHPLDARLGGAYADFRFPLGHDGGQALAQPAAVPALQHGLARVPVGARADAQDQRRVAAQQRARLRCILVFTKSVQSHFYTRILCFLNRSSKNFRTSRTPSSF